ncbi:Lrp/AsnC family transcriptional regulator [Arthrobacter gandavensis]|uniref:Lrp/AsnC family transcriptional regulator n=1 Tax=Arthrobacter gandavensis TaxID=169960 RepID=A0ABP5ARC5_9MICC|nr:winged helix-turn-helix transcriptional regulator [Arthrobacter citreus]
MNRQLDEDDLLLINALQIGPRLPWTAIGAVLDRHPTSLALRWEKLAAAGAAWITSHPVGDPEQMSLSFHDVQCDPAQRRSVVQALADMPDVFSIDECHRNRDMMLTVITPTPAWLAESVYPLFDRIPGLTRYETSFCTQLHHGADSWQLGALNAAQRKKLSQLAGNQPAYRGPLPPAYGEILQVLSRNGRASAADIAAETGLHPATARRQLQKVLGSGSLALRCEVAHGLAGFPIICQWFARLPAAEHSRTASALAESGTLRLCASTTGPTNFTFMMWLRSAADIMNTERSLGERFPALEVTESVVVATVAKRVGWILNRNGTAAGNLTVPGEAWKHGVS